MNAQELRPLLKERGERESLTIELAADIALPDGGDGLLADWLAVVVRSPDLPREQQYALLTFDPKEPVEPQLDRLVATWREANA